MAGRSTLDPENLPRGRKRKTLKGHDTRSLGPSDSSDSGSDLAAPGTDALIGDLGMDAASDRWGTGERQTVGKEPQTRVNVARFAPVERPAGDAKPLTQMSDQAMYSSGICSVISMSQWRFLPATTVAQRRCASSIAAPRPRFA